MDDMPFLKVLVVIVVMVAIAGLAETDANNPLTEIGLPVSADSFNVYALGAQAPQLPAIQVPTFNETEKNCWISWWCPSLPTDAVAQAITQGVITVYGFFSVIINGVLWGSTVAALLLVNFLSIFNFTSWSVFQGDVFLVIFAVLLTIILGGLIVLWIFSRIMDVIPFLGSGSGV